MKSNVFKYLFIIFVIIIAIGAFFIIQSNENEQETQEDTSAEDTQEIVREIRLGIAQYDTLNPLLTTNKNVQDISKLIFDPLVTLSSDYKAEPCLAIEWAKQAFALGFCLFLFCLCIAPVLRELPFCTAGAAFSSSGSCLFGLREGSSCNTGRQSLQVGKAVPEKRALSSSVFKGKH